MSIFSCQNYDKHLQERNFKPGDKVLALFPIPGRSLQARYVGPYIIDKNVSDLNYVLQTQDRRKQKQLCHINMLKKYVERGVSDNIVYPVSVVSSDPASDDYSEPAGTPKLQNSDILKDLDSKLTHLRPEEWSVIQTSA